jgi:hypothetical protein
VRQLLELTSAHVRALPLLCFLLLLLLLLLLFW